MEINLEADGYNRSKLYKFHSMKSRIKHSFPFSLNKYTRNKKVYYKIDSIVFKNFKYGCALYFGKKLRFSGFYSETKDKKLLERKPTIWFRRSSDDLTYECKQNEGVLIDKSKVVPRERVIYTENKILTHDNPTRDGEFFNMNIYFNKQLFCLFDPVIVTPGSVKSRDAEDKIINNSRYSLLPSLFFDPDIHFFVCFETPYFKTAQKLTNEQIYIHLSLKYDE